MSTGSTEPCGERMETQANGFWCIWGFWTNEDSIADRRPTGGEERMP